MEVATLLTLRNRGKLTFQYEKRYYFPKKLSKCVGGQVKHLAIYQFEVGKGKLTAVES